MGRESIHHKTKHLAPYRNGLKVTLTIFLTMHRDDRSCSSYSLYIGLNGLTSFLTCIYFLFSTYDSYGAFMYIQHLKLVHFHLTGGEQIAKSVTQMWYSLRLSEEDFKLVMCTLQELIHASSLEGLTRGIMRMEQDHLHTLVQVWHTWLYLGSREGQWITEKRQRKVESYPGSEKGIKLYLDQIPEEHKESASDWFANGILLPKALRKELTRENVTLTGFPNAYLNQTDVPYQFSYILDPSVIPFTSWDYKDVKQHFHCASLLKMYSQYVSHLLETCVATLASGKVKFHFMLCDCMEMSSFLSPNRKYDRVTTSNVADYLPLTNILDMCKPLLNTANTSAVIITEFHNWHERTSLNEKLLSHFSQLSQSFHQKVLEDTQNPAIAFSQGRVAFMDYYDLSEEFIQFLRAALLVDHKIKDKVNRQRTWSSVADYNGLVARDFLRCQNRVFPAKWMQNCCRVTMMSGFERAVEWIVSPQKCS